MVSDLPAPLVPPDVDLRDFAFMPLDVVRLRDSDISAKATAEEFRCAVLLWCASWHQVPAASLPDDDAILSNLAGFGRAVGEWKKHRDGALWKWVKCNDGRLYHPVVAEKAIDSWQAKKRQRDRTEAARAARLSQKPNASVASSVTEREERPTRLSRRRDDNVTESVTSSKGQGQYKGQGEVDKQSAQQPVSRERPKIDLDRLEAALRGAAGLENDPSPGLLDLSPILGFLDANGSLDETILPALRAAKARGRRGSSWKYYIPAIRDAIAARQGGASSAPRASPPPDPNDPPVDLGCGRAPRLSALRGHLAAWVENRRLNRWNEALYGGPPDEPSCRVPESLLAEFGLQRVAYPVEGDAA